MYAVSEQLTRKKLFALFLDIYKQLNHKISRQLVVIKKEADFHFFFQIWRKNLLFRKYPDTCGQGLIRVFFLETESVYNQNHI